MFVHEVELCCTRMLSRTPAPAEHANLTVPTQRPALAAGLTSVVVGFGGGGRSAQFAFVTSPARGDVATDSRMGGWLMPSADDLEMYLPCGDRS